MIQQSKGLKNIVIIRKWEKTIGINSTNLLNKLKMKENKMTNLPIRCKWIMNQKSRNRNNSIRNSKIIHKNKAKKNMKS